MLDVTVSLKIIFDMKILREINKIKNVVIIGGSGCIGTATCNYFTTLGIAVTVIDIVPPEDTNLNYIIIVI